MEKEKTREAEPEQKDTGAQYERTLEMYAAARERARNGKIVIRGRDLPWRQSRMGCTKGFLSWQRGESAVEDWTCFIKNMQYHSGKHRHQGGIMLFVIEGEGYTVVDGEKVEWEKGDLIVLPVKPDGCEHQHFNKDQGKPAKWMAFRYHPFSGILGNMFDHVEDRPDWEERDAS